jgi:hypothetical protein
MTRIFTLFLLFATASSTAQTCGELALSYFPPILVKERVFSAKGKAGLELEKGVAKRSFFDFLPKSLKSWLEIDYFEEVVASETMQNVNSCSCGLYYKYHGKVISAVKDASDYASRMAIAGPYMSDYGEEFVSRCLNQTNKEKQPDSAPDVVTPKPPEDYSPDKPKKKPTRKRKPTVDCQGSAAVKLERGQLFIHYPCIAPSGISGEYWVSTCCPSYSNETVQDLPPLVANQWNSLSLDELSIPKNARSVRVDVYENPSSRSGKRRLIGRMILNFAR